MKNNIRVKWFYLSFFVLMGCSLMVNNTSARENVTDWYIKNFDAKIVVNKDSSLDITETILADCGTASGKHGIFRILPEEISVTEKGDIETPIELQSIEDTNGNSYNYSESKDFGNNTITWKIGDADKFVQGENMYVIKYRVENTIRFWNSDFDEWYWNLTGNFWDLEIDKAHIEVIFPEEVNKENSTVDLYAGSLGDKGSNLASYKWNGNNVLGFDSSGILKKKQGITASVTFPKNIFIPYQPSFWERYGWLFSLIIPVVIFFVCLRLWIKYGKDPKIDKTIIAEYEAPLGMSPFEVGMLMTNGGMKNDFITAEIINLAVKKILIIKEIDNKILFFHSKDFEFSRMKNMQEESTLNKAQKVILDKLFEDGDVINLSSLKNSFYRILSDVKEKGKQMLLDKNMITSSGLSYGTGFLIGGIMAVFGGFFLIGFSVSLALAIILSGVIVVIFGVVMPKRTIEGAEANWKIKGFKLFMETVDKDRAKFYEQENIFEKFLPYAIVFGITEIWIKRIKEIYGEDYFRNYTPVWYAGSLASFDADSFASEINNLSSSIAANTSAPSGSGGSGGSGGGGGGGGGGGW